MRTLMRNLILLTAGVILLVLALFFNPPGETYAAKPLKVRQLTPHAVPYQKGLPFRTMNGTEQQTLETFFPELFATYQKPYLRLRNPDITGVIRQFRLDKGKETRYRIAFLFFLHDLFTGSGVRNGKTGGLLGIPYYKHWTIPNPRHALVRSSDGTPLTALKPPGTHSRYDTLADLDRTPDIYLGDLVRGPEQYRSPEGKTFSTFGWCSEREMAFTALLTLYGYEAKIIQRGSHTHTEVRLTLADPKGAPVPLIISVDNTFDKIRIQRDAAPEKAFEEWAFDDIGAGTFIIWYNERARDPLLLDTLRQMAVTPEAQVALQSRLESRL